MSNVYLLRMMLLVCWTYIQKNMSSNPILYIKEIIILLLDVASIYHYNPSLLFIHLSFGNLLYTNFYKFLYKQTLGSCSSRWIGWCWQPFSIKKNLFDNFARVLRFHIVSTFNTFISCNHTSAHTERTYRTLSSSVFFLNFG